MLLTTVHHAVPHGRTGRSRWTWRLAIAVALLVVGAAHPALAQTAARTLYERTLAREQEVRSLPSPTAAQLRAIAAAYEALVRKYPGSGYADNALWQGGGLLLRAFEGSSEAADRRGAERLFTWLRNEYPSSSFIRKIEAQLGDSPKVSSEPLPADPPVPAPERRASPTRVRPPAAGAAATITGITRATLPRGERITIELSKEVMFTGDRVNNPDRVFIDFASAAAPAAVLEQAQAASGSLIKSLRLGRQSDGVMRVVLDLAGSPRYTTFPLYEPFRLVIDVEETGPNPSSFIATPAPPSRGSGPVLAIAAGGSMPESTRTPAPAERPTPPPVAVSPVATPLPGASVRLEAPPPVGSPVSPASNRSGDYSLSRQLGLGVSRIVIDAGHGGHDPGARANGLDEAELVLDVARRLEKLLTEAPGFQVRLTRTTDEYIPLEERTALANREGADLFLSIHANASRQTSARGVETYFLNFATNPTAEAVAARENASSAQSMGKLPGLVKAIALNDKLAESRELATLVQSSLIKRLSLQNKGVKDLGVKQAPFVVLIGAQMPSVLAEISFLSNKSEASLLKQGSYRQKIAQALFDAVVKYQASLKTTMDTTRQKARDIRQK